MSRRVSRIGRTLGFSATEEDAAHKLADRFSQILGTYIDPYTLDIFPARGYWTHIHQDVQRFTGVFPRPDLPRLEYNFGSWDLTVSDIAKGRRFKVDDQRAVPFRGKYADFEISSEPAKRRPAPSTPAKER